MSEQTPLTDDQFLDMCGFKAADFKDADHRVRVLAMLASRRATIGRLDAVATELNLWSIGLGPKPEGIIVCHEHRVGGRKLSR
jgi:hypothetical protein